MVILFQDHGQNSKPIQGMKIHHFAAFSKKSD